MWNSIHGRTIRSDVLVIAHYYSARDHLRGLLPKGSHGAVRHHRGMKMTGHFQSSEAWGPPLRNATWLRASGPHFSIGICTKVRAHGSLSATSAAWIDAATVSIIP